MDVIIILLIAIVAVLVFTNGFLLWFFSRTTKRIDLLLEKGKVKDLKQVFFNQADKLKEQDAELKSGLERIKNLEDISQKTFQKIGIVRFNPFSEVGGNQSFVIALLDNKNNGFVISSLFFKDGNRVYAKTINQGKSDHKLSSEEEEAVARAAGSK